MRKSRRRLVLPVTIGTIVGSLVAGAGWQVAGTDTARDVSPVAVYEGLQRDALNGDARAEEYLTSLDEYLAAHDRQVADLDTRETDAVTVTSGIETFRLVGTQPWHLRVMNDTVVEDSVQFEAYKALRHGALSLLATIAPGREIEVVVTPTDLVDVSDFVESLGCRCRVVTANADVFADGVWFMSVGGASTDGAHTTGSGMEDGLWSAGTDALVEFPSVEWADIAMTVRTVRLRLSASEAERLVDNEAVLLVDTTADVHDRFRQRAAVVTVHNTPDVFYTWYATQELRIDLTPSSIEAVGDEDPAEAELDRIAGEQMHSEVER